MPKVPRLYVAVSKGTTGYRVWKAFQSRGEAEYFARNQVVGGAEVIVYDPVGTYHEGKAAPLRRE